MTRPSVAIVKSDFHDSHTSAWSREWLAACMEQGLAHELLEWRGLGSFEAIARHRIVLWHFSHYSLDEMRFARPILAALKAAGCVVFPDHGDADHFDDKIAQAYMFKALGILTPENHVLHSREAVSDWIETVGVFPVVAKLRGGSGSSNVRLIADKEQLVSYARRMFDRGFNSSPSAILKISSNARSARSFKDVVTRLKRGPEFLFSLANARRFPRENGYVYLQEYVPGVDYDLKVAVVGDRLSYICRSVRKGDFRASGGGGLYYDRSMVTPAIVRAAFDAAAVMKSDCIGFDMITDPQNGRAVILEASYGFSHMAVIAAGESCDRRGKWHSAPLNAPRAVLARLMQRAANE